MRGKQAIKRVVAPDPKFKQESITRFTNYIMRGGKKSIAMRIVYGALDIVSEKTKIDGLEIFDQAIKNVAPTVEIRGKRVGGANYQVPVAVRAERSFALACRWIINAAASRKGKPMMDKLAEELLSAYNNEGAAIKKKLDVYKMAEANRAFAHFSR